MIIFTGFPSSLHLPFLMINIMLIHIIWWISYHMITITGFPSDCHLWAEWGPTGTTRPGLPRTRPATRPRPPPPNPPSTARWVTPRPTGAVINRISNVHFVLTVLISYRVFENTGAISCKITNMSKKNGTWLYKSYYKNRRFDCKEVNFLQNSKSCLTDFNN